MKVNIEATPKEIAALVVALQERQGEGRVYTPSDVILTAFRSAIDDIAGEEQRSS